MKSQNEHAEPMLSSQRRTTTRVLMINVSFLSNYILQMGQKKEHKVLQVKLLAKILIFTLICKQNERKPKHYAEIKTHTDKHIIQLSKKYTAKHQRPLKKWNFYNANFFNSKNFFVFLQLSPFLWIVPRKQANHTVYFSV